MSRTQWQFVCRQCDQSAVPVDDVDDDEASVCCGVCSAPFGTWGEIKQRMVGASAGEDDPSSSLVFRKVEPKH